MKKEFVLDQLTNGNAFYLKADKLKCEEKNLKEEITMDFFALYRIDEITFEDKAPRKEALENVISSMSIPGINFVYVIRGDSSGVSFYYGIAKDFSYKGEQNLSIYEIGQKILQPSLQGNFRGSVITEINANERKEILSSIDAFEEVRILEGVPGINKDDEKFQSVDRVIDVMLGDPFTLMLIAKPITETDINKVQNNMYHLYDSIFPLSKSSVQESIGKSSGSSKTKSNGNSKTEGTSYSKSEQEGTSTSESHTKGKSSGNNTGHTYNNQSGGRASTGGSTGSHEDTNESDSFSKSENKSESTATSNSTSTSKSNSNAESTQTGNNTGSATTLEVVNKKVQNWIKYMDEVVLPRLDYGLGKGLFVTSTVLLGDNPASLIKIENTLKSIYGGESGNRMPLRAFRVDREEAKLFKRMQIPILQLGMEANENELSIRTACSQFYVDSKHVLLGNWMSSQEVSLLAGLPQKEVVGLALRGEVEFGLNIKMDMKEPILLGHLVQSGVVLDGKKGVPNIPVNFDKAYFDKHIFVTGVTGGGKTTTCQKLLLASKNNFLVIEPAKTEYRVMVEEFPDMLVFTLGKETGAPFRLNPFEFFEGENITSRVDMIKASMEAAFDMEAAIPQLLETAIYECYEEKGWNISTNKNYKYENPFADGVYSFPTLSDLERKIEGVVKEQGFDDRLRDEYIGSMKARLKGLTVGAKGQMLNTPRSIDFAELLDRKVILELEYIKSASEKSLIMGFILSNLSEAIRVKYNQNGKKAINHLTLIEEAHRLLSKYMPGDSMNKKQGVEMFSDMLAEVRKYGESLIIADQIPNKLTPEVLKNTNTKIVHKIFAQDDKEAIGNTMALTDEQKEHLSYLTSGRAIMMMPGLSKAIQIQIEKTDENNTERPPVEDSVLRNRIISYYSDAYMKGILPGLERLGEKPDENLVRLYLDELQFNSRIEKGYWRLIHWGDASETLVSELRKLKESYDLTKIAQIICCHCYSAEHLAVYPKIVEYTKEIFDDIVKIGSKYKLQHGPKRDLLDELIETLN